MSANATLNVRLPEQLKSHGTQVLERAGIGASQAIRALYEYMEREQSVPDCILPNTDADKYEHRRNRLKAFAGRAEPLSPDWTMNDIRSERLARLIDGELS